MSDQNYSVIVWNEQGASDENRELDSREEVESYLSTWGDLENLRIQVSQGYGNIVATKAIGDESLDWKRK